MTSHIACSPRAEYRLLLRHDNADRRLTPLGRRVRLVADDAWQRLVLKERAIEEITAHLRRVRHNQETLEKLLRRPDVDWSRLCELDPTLRQWNAQTGTIEQVVLETRYAGYIERQAAQVERFHRLESRPIPRHFDFQALPQLRAEAKEKLSQIRPASLGQASRISGISPADIAVLMMYLGSATLM